jgi:hypothetical protein
VTAAKAILEISHKALAVDELEARVAELETRLPTGRN